MTTATHPQKRHRVNWKPATLYTSRILPANANTWLLDTGSLTQKLIQVSNNNLKVNILSQRWAFPEPQDIALLGIKRRQKALIREVTLCSNDQALVYARSVLPHHAVKGRYRYLRRFKARSLGERLFTDPAIYRSSFEIAQIEAQTLNPALSLPDKSALWGRRRLFYLDHSAILVSEFFLPDFDQSS